MEILKAINICKVYGAGSGYNSTKALNNVSFEISEGEFVGIMGASGCGKTTLLNILSGITKQSSGSIEIDGQNINSLSDEELAVFRRRRIGFIFQDFNLLDSLTLQENIMLPLILDRKSSKEIKQSSMELMKLLDIEKVANKYPTVVSGGEQQRTAVARALIHDPAIIFADEPTGNLDSIASNSVMKCLQFINKSKNASILLVTHDAFVASFCKRIIFLKDGLIYKEIHKKSSRIEFYNEILECISAFGGGISDNEL